MANEDIKNLKVLSKYGKVITCKKVHEDVVTIVISDGFSEKGMTVMNFIKECGVLFPDHPKLETIVTEENLAVLVLKK